MRLGNLNFFGDFWLPADTSLNSLTAPLGSSVIIPVTKSLQKSRYNLFFKMAEPLSMSKSIQGLVLQLRRGNLSTVLLGIVLLACLLNGLVDVARHVSLTMMREAFDAAAARAQKKVLYPGGENPKTVWVVSHRRSGTHMTIDATAQAIAGPLRIIKAAHIVPMTDELSCDCMTYLQHHGKFIHPYRDVRDVVIANYFYRIKFDRDYKGVNFTSYLANKNDLLGLTIRSWARSYVGWFQQPNVLSLNFDETALGLPYVYDRIASFLGQAVKNYNVSPSNMQSPSRAVSKFAGKGSAGWKIMMSSSSAKKVVDAAREYLKQVAKHVLKCRPQTKWNMEGAFRVGNATDLFVPASCPKDFKLMPVVVTASSDPSKTVRRISH